MLLKIDIDGFLLISYSIPPQVNLFVVIFKLGV